MKRPLPHRHSLFFPARMTTRSNVPPLHAATRSEGRSIIAPTAHLDAQMSSNDAYLLLHEHSFLNKSMVLHLLSSEETARYHVGHHPTIAAVTEIYLLCFSHEPSAQSNRRLPIPTHRPTTRRAGRTPRPGYLFLLAQPTGHFYLLPFPIDALSPPLRRGLHHLLLPMSSRDRQALGTSCLSAPLTTCLHSSL